jgi:hypothetical protein
MRLCCALLLSLLAFISHGLASGKKLSPEPLSSNQTTQAYALLWGVASKNQHVDKIFLLKTARPATGAEVKKIADLYVRIVEKLELLKVGGVYVPDLKTGLPQAEEQARAAVESENARHLFGTSGPPFDLALLGTQAQALLYTRSLLTVLERNNVDRAAGKMFRGFLAESDTLLKEVYALQAKLPAEAR